MSLALSKQNVERWRGGLNQLRLSRVTTCLMRCTVLFLIDQNNSKKTLQLFRHRIVGGDPHEIQLKYERERTLLSHIHI